MTFAARADITRRFRDRDKPPTSPTFRRQMGRFRGAADQTWASLLPDAGKELAIHGVVLEAGSGTGKSTEVEAQAKRLRSSGVSAFFLPGRRVASVGLVAALSEKDAEPFRRWKASTEIGIFFVDAVDELYLEHRSSTDLFRELEREIDFVSADVLLVMTARTGTWSAYEATLLRKCLGLRDKRKAQKARLGAARSKKRAATLLREGSNKDPQPWEPVIKCVTFEPLDSEDVRRLAEFYGATDAQAFSAEFDENEVADFMDVRPRDVQLLVQYWNRHKRLGTWTDIARWFVTWTYPELNPDRHHRGLSLVEYADGLKRVAAASLLTKEPHVVLPSTLALPGATHASLLFPDWPPAKLAELFSSPLFVPKAESAVQLPQGAVTQCLAALWFGARYQADRDLESIVSGIFTVVPGRLGYHLADSRRQVAGWLATTITDFRKPLRLVAPDVLLHFGDPAGLDGREIGIAINDLVARRAIRRWEWPTQGTLVRLARPELDDTLIDLLRREREPEMLWHLLRFAEAGRYPQCVAFARELALDEKRAGQAHGVAVRIVRKRGSKDDRRALRGLLGSGSLDTKAALVATLVPDLMSATELAALLVGGCNYSVAREFAAKCSELEGADLDLILKSVDAKLRSNPKRTSRRQRAHFNDESESALAHVLCSAFVQRLGHPLPKRLPGYLSRVPVTIQLVAEHEYIDSDLVKEVSDALQMNARIRRGVWKEKLALLRLDRHLHDHSLPVVAPLVADDFDWLHAESRKARNADLKDLVHFIITGAYLRLGEAQRVASRALARGALADALDATDVHQRAADEARRKREALDLRRATATRRKNREQVRPRIARIRSGRDTNSLLWAWQQMRSSHSERARVSTEGLSELVGPDLAEEFLTGFAAMWRGYSVAVPKAGSNQVLFTTMMALTGVTVEYQRGLDFGSLNVAEARTAALLAASELNGFPSWMEPLVREQPEQVRAALFDTISDEWDCPKETHGVLRFAPWEPNEVGALMKEIVLDLASSRAPAHSRTIHDAANAILISAGEVERSAGLASGMTREATAVPETCSEWLRLWAHTSPEEAAEWVASLRTTSPSLFTDLIFRVAAMLGHDFDRDRGKVSSAFFTSQGVRAWLPLLMDVVAPAQDISHAGVHAVGGRDNAQALREKCLSALVQEGSPESYGILKRLAEANSGTRYGESIIGALSSLEKQAIENAAEPWTVDAILDFERGHATTPTSMAGMFSIVQRHLREIGESQEVGDFSHRELFAPRPRKRGQSAARVELPVQRWVAATLQLLARGLYSVQREEEVQDENSVDICARIPGVGRLPIEIKPIGPYTEKVLKDTIKSQLLGKYMRPREVTHGILLLVRLTNKSHKVGRVQRAAYEDLLAAVSEFARGFAVSHGKVISVESISVAAPRQPVRSQPKVAKAVGRRRHKSPG